MAQELQQKLVISLRGNTTQDPNNQWARQAASLVNEKQDRIVVIVETTTPSQSDLLIVYEDGDGLVPYHPVTWFDTTLDRTGTNMSIDLTFYRRRRITFPIEYYLCYFISIIVFEYIYSLAHNGKRLRTFKTHEFDQISDLVWHGNLPESAVNTANTLSSSLPMGRDREILEACNQIRLLGQSPEHQLSVDARSVADFLKGLVLPNIADPYHHILRKFREWGPRVASTTEQRFTAADPMALFHFIDSLEEAPTKDSVDLLGAIAAAGNIEDEAKSYAQAAYERLTKGKPRAIAEVVTERIVKPDVGDGDTMATAMANMAEHRETQSGRITNIVDFEKENPAIAGRYGISGDHTAATDSLGYSEYAKALAQVIANKNSKPPLTIGICAPWGRGKSTLMNLIVKELEIINGRLAKSPDPDYSQSKILQFDAWRYSKADQIWAGFIDCVMRELQKDFDGWWRKLLLAFRLNKSLDLPLVGTLVTFLAIAAVMLLILLLVLPGEYKGIGFGIWFVSAVAVYRKVLPGAWKLASSPITERIIALSRLPNYQSRLDPIHKILTDIDLICSEYSKIPGKESIKRFVVFVDDIDRCSPDKIMETLEAMKHFLGMNQFVFAVAMDAHVVRHAIGEHYKFMGEESEQCEEMGRFYLEKILQIPFSLPRVGGERLKDLNKVLLSDYIAKEGAPTTTTVPSDRGTDQVPEEPPETPRMENGSVVQPPKETPPEPPTDITTIERTPAGIGGAESRTIYGILETPGMELSPRLFKRFINIYLIARDLHFTQQRRLSIDSSPPEPDMAKWLALSVVYPFEAKALLRWFEEHNWADPSQGENPPLSDAWVPDNAESGFRCRWVHFRTAYKELKIQHKVVQQTKFITNCFNLVLD